jgi:hypothetical protein
MRLSAGTHHVTVIGKDYEVEQQTFTVRRGQNPALQITLRSRNLAAASVPPSNPASKAPDKNGPVKDEAEAGEQPVESDDPGDEGAEAPSRLTRWRDPEAWTIQEQELLQPNPRGGHWLYFGDPAWTDYDVEVEAATVTGDGEINLAFRAAGQQKYLYVALGGFKNTHHALLSRKEVGPRPIDTLQWVLGQTTPGRWYRLRVEARGSHFIVLLDGKQILAVITTQYPQGCVGLATVNTSVRYRNLKVTDPGGKVLWEGWPQDLPRAPQAKQSPTLTPPPGRLAVPHSGAPDVKLLDDVMLKYQEKLGCSAAALAVERNGVLIHLQAYGWCDPDHKETVRPETLFRVPLNSGVRTMLAASIRQLAWRKRLNLNDSVLKLLKIEPAGKVVDPRVWKITVEHVLEHKTGWDNEQIQQANPPADAQQSKTPPLELQLGILAIQPLKEAPGTLVRDSRFFNQVLMHLLTKVTGKSPAEYFRQELLGREVTGIAAPGSAQLQAPRAAVWNADGGLACASAPALLEVVRNFASDGTPVHSPGFTCNVGNASCTCYLSWRKDRIHVVALFNGNGRGSVHDFGAELRQAINTMKAGSQ